MTLNHRHSQFAAVDSQNLDRNRIHSTQDLPQLRVPVPVKTRRSAANHLSIVITIVLGMAGIGRSQTTNATVTNSGFESGNLASWTVWNGTVASISKTPHSGSHSLAVTGSAPSSGVFQDISDLYVGYQYVVSAWVKVEAGVTASLYLDDGVNPASALQAWQGSTAGFQYISVPFVATASGKVRIHLWIGAGSGTVYWDDISIVPAFMVKDAGFESGNLAAWTVWNGTASSISKTPHSGSYSLAVTGSAPSGVLQDIYSSNSNAYYGVYPGAQYLASAWVKVGAGVTASLYIDDGVDPATEVQAWQGSTAGFQYISVPFVATASGKIRIHLWIGAGSGTVYWDDISIVGVLPVKNYGFESGNSTSWTAWKGTAASISRTAHSGSYSLAVTGSAQDQSGVLQNVLGLLPYQQYVVSAWVIVDPGVTASLYLDDGVDPATEIQAWQGLTAGFQYISLPFMTGSNGEVLIHLSIGAGSGTVYWDDISVVAANSYVEYN